MQRVILATCISWVSLTSAEEQNAVHIGAPKQKITKYGSKQYKKSFVLIVLTVIKLRGDAGNFLVPQF